MYLTLIVAIVTSNYIFRCSKVSILIENIYISNLEATGGGGGNIMRYCQVPDVEALPGEAKQDALLVAQD